MEKTKLFSLILAVLLTTPLFAQKDYAQLLRAERLLEDKSLDSAAWYLSKNELKTNHDKASNLRAQAALLQLYCFKEDFEKARPLLNEILAQANDLLAQTTLTELEAVAVYRAFQVANQYENSQDNFDKALSHIQQAMQVCKKFVKDRQHLTAIATNLFGNTLIKMRRMDEAIDALNKAIMLNEKILHSNFFVETDSTFIHSKLAMSHNNLGACYELKEDYDKAFFYYEKAYQIRQTHLPAEHPDIAQSIYNLSELYRFRGNNEKALELLANSLERYKKIYGENHSEIADFLVNMSDNYVDINDLERAQSHLENALQIYKRQGGEQSSNLAMVYKKLGLILSYKKQPEAARTHYMKALNVVKSGNAREIADLNNEIANSHFSSGNQRDGEIYYKKAIAIYNSSDDFQIGLSNTYINYGEYLLRYGKPNEARSLFLKADAIFSKIETDYQFYLYKNYLKIAETYLQDEQQFNLYINKILLGLEKDANSTSTYPLLKLKTHLLLAQVQKGKGEFNQALNSYQQCKKLIDELRLSLTTTAAKLELLEDATSTFHHICLLALQQFEASQRDDYFEEAFRASEFSKAALLLDAVKDLQSKKVAGISSYFLERERKLKKELAFLEREIFNASKTPEEVEYMADLRAKHFKIAEQYKKTLDSIATKFPNYYQMRYQTQVVSIEKLQKTLQPKQALLAYELIDSILLIFHFTQKEKGIVSVNLKSKLPNDIFALRQAIIDRDKATYTSTAHQLYQTLFSALPKHLQTAQQFIIIPDKELSYLPFDLLLTEAAPANASYKELPYLLKKQAVVYHYSATLFTESLKQKTRASQFFLGIAPDFADNSLEKLPYAQQEVKSIASSFSSKLLLAKTATPSAFFENAPKYQVIHLATHAFVNNENPLFSYFALFPDDAKQEGAIYSHDLYNMELAADLVVLSACNSGMGEWKKGEGVMSLARGFAYAGCPNTVMSHWAIADKATYLLMEYFYKEIKAGNSKSEALRRAKLALLQASADAQSAPFYWGGMLLVGNPEAIAIRTASSNIWRIGIVALLLAGCCFIVVKAAMKRKKPA